MAIDNSCPLPQCITILIHVTVMKKIGPCGFSKSDQEDLEQQIAMEVIRRRAKFDPCKAQEKTFLARLVKHAFADIVGARNAACRDYHREKSILSQWVLVSDSEHPLCREWASRADTITEDDAKSRLGPAGTPDEELRDLSIDLADAASRLSPDLREIYRLRKDLGSAHAAADAMGVNPSTVYDALKQIKTHFEAAGLAIYLPKPRANPTDSGARR